MAGLGQWLLEKAYGASDKMSEARNAIRAPLQKAGAAVQGGVHDAMLATGTGIVEGAQGAYGAGQKVYNAGLNLYDQAKNYVSPTATPQVDNRDALSQLLAGKGKILEDPQTIKMRQQGLL